jgi:AcrR family transcriptional regulator
MASIVPVQGRAEATRRALLVAAATRFAEVGYHGTALSEVIAACKVTKGALYFHFLSKQALADAVVAEMVAGWKVMVPEIRARGLDPLWTLLAQSDEAMAHVINDPIVRGGLQLLTEPRAACANGTTHYLYVEVTTTEQLTAAAIAGLLRPGLDPPRIARVITSMITGVKPICDHRQGHLQGPLHDSLRHPEVLWNAVTDLWQGLLPAIATDRWLEHWQAADWPRRPMPKIT